MAVVVRAAGAGAGHTSLDIAERQVLLGLDQLERGCAHEHHALLFRVSEARWVCLNSAGEVEVINTSEEFIIVPVMRNALFPAGARPLLGTRHLTEAELDTARAQGRQLAEVMGFGVDLVGPVVNAQWTFADTAHPLFATVVPANLV